MTIQLDAKTSPSTGSEILEIAALNCGLIVRAPRPTVIIKSITRIYTEFDITFFVEELTSSAKARNQLFDLTFGTLPRLGFSSRQARAIKTKSRVRQRPELKGSSTSCRYLLA